MRGRKKHSQVKWPEIVRQLQKQLSSIEKRLAKSEAERKKLEDEREKLGKRIAQLEMKNAALRKNSATSSKPPSSDIVKPPKPTANDSQKQQKRKIGGQPGHPRHQRKPFTEKQIDDSREYHLDQCPKCKTEMTKADVQPRVIQQIELVEILTQTTEHLSFGYYCPTCDEIHYAPVPSEVKKGGLAGPQLTALVAYLKGACHASYTTIQKFLRDIFSLELSRGYIADLIKKTTHALDAPYHELLDRLPDEPILNVDETGHKNNKERYWTWCFRAELYTLFKIDPSRGSQVLMDVLGEEFNGILGCDYFSAYRKYMRLFGVELQFCLAHLIRDVRFLTTLPDKATREYGERVLEGLKNLFGVIHRRESMSASRFAKELRRARRAIMKVGKQAPNTRKAQNLANRFRKHGDAYFKFMTTPNVSPTNNLAEQAIRFVVIDRHITQGTRSEIGRQWCERIWTVMATCSQQAKSVFEYIREAILSYFQNQPPPLLLPEKP